jgi:hypothetical protein
MPVIIDQITATVVQPEASKGEKSQSPEAPAAKADPRKHRETLHLIHEREARVRAD